MSSLFHCGLEKHQRGVVNKGHTFTFFTFHSTKKCFFSLVGVVKGVLTTIIGFFTFGGVPVTVLVILGVSLNTFGGAAYSYAKYAEKMTTEIEKHVHKHSIRVVPDKLLEEHLEKQKNGLVSSSCDQDHRTKNGVKTLELDGISESHVVVEVDDGQDFVDLNSNSESSVDWPDM